MDYSLIQQDLEETPEGEVYFIFRKDKERKCKIGKSIDPSNRIKGLQTGNHNELYIYKTLKGYDKLERMLHNYFAEYRIRKTEWFDITLEDVDDVVDQYNMFEAMDEEKDNILDEGSLDEIEDQINEGVLVEEIIETRTTRKYVNRTNNESFVCIHCNQSFSGQRYLTRHIDSNICRRIHECTKCGKEFTSAANKKQHLLRKIPCDPKDVPVLNDNENKCMYCNKCFARPYSLRRHMDVCPIKNNHNLLQTLVDQNTFLLQKMENLEKQLDDKLL